MKTKFKVLLCLTIMLIILISQFSVFAGEIFIKDIAHREGYMQAIALTKDGVVFNNDNIAENGKTKIKENVAELTDSLSVFLLKNGDVDFGGKIISGLNVKEIVTVNHYFYYKNDVVVFISNDDALKAYDCRTDECCVIVENVADCRFGEGWLSAKTKTNDLFSVKSDRSGSTLNEIIKVEFIASDICDYDKLYFLKNNGDLYYILNGSSNLVLNNADVQIGLKIKPTVLDKAVVYSNGSFVFVNKGAIEQKYFCNRGAKDITQLGDDIFYIGNDGLLYYLDVRSYYGYHAPGTEIEYCFSSNLHFQKLYYTEGYIYCLDEYNNLYIPLVETGYIDSNGNNYNGRYENIRVSLGNFAPNAVPEKMLGNFVLTKAGECFVRSSNSIYMTDFCKKKLNLLVNNNAVDLVAPIQNKNDRTMYPLRECFEAMGAAVSWDGINRIAIGEMPGVKIEFPIGKSEYYVNGLKYEMDTVSYIDDNLGRTYIPIRYAAEGLGFSVDWIPGDIENTISIHK